MEFESPAPARPRIGPWTWIGGAALLLVLLVLVGVPAFSIVQAAFREGTPSAAGAWTLRHAIGFFTLPEYHRSTLNTLRLAAIALAICVPLGSAWAWLVARTDLPGRRIVHVGNLIPYMFPTFLAAIGWTFLGKVARIDVHTLTAIGVILGLELVPITYLLAVSAFAGMDASLEEAAAVSGATRRQTALHVTLPLMMPAIAAAAILAFVSILENFGTPLVLGTPARIHVLMTQIYADQVYAAPRFGPSGFIAVLFLLAVTAMMLAYYRLIRAGGKFVTVTGKVTRPATVRLGVWRYPAFAAWAAFFGLAVVLPYGALAIVSFHAYPELSLRHLTAANYLEMFGEAGLFRALVNSLIWPFVGALLALALAFCVALVNLRTAFPLRRLLDLLTTMPVAMPGVVLGAALLWFWVANPLPVYGTVGIVVIVFVTRYLPLAQRSVTSTMLQVHRDLEYAAAACGAPPRRVLTDVTIPLTRSGLLAGWLLLWMSMFRELGAVVMVYSTGSLLLPIAILQAWDEGAVQVATALATVQALIALIAVASFVRLDRRAGTGFL